MKRFLTIALTAWAFILAAFWIASGLKWVTEWSDGARGVCCAVLIGSLLITAIDTSKNK